MLSFSVLYFIVLLMLLISRSAVNPHILFTLLAVGFGVGVTGSYMMHNFYNGLEKKHGWDSSTRILVDLMLHILPMIVVYFISKDVPLDMKHVWMYVGVAWMSALVYSQLADLTKVYPEVPVSLFYLIYPVAVVLPFLLRATLPSS